MINWLLTPLPVWKEIIFIAAPGWLLAIAGWLVAWRNQNVIEDVSAEKQQEIDKLIVERNEARKQRDKLNTENAKLAGYLDNADKRVVASEEANKHLHAQNADLREALQEKIVEIKALHMQTVEVEEVKPEPAKRTTRKKAGQA